ncbi:MAG: c-type cytochrome biogenesis protein CcsB [Deltaproteobacteria bacterium]|nr:c-type cytochrome biogenesis protein CcsB [Deltaproteobacteria bacterium]MBW2333789.1 c-type cytochrome biogenesis protein CcsB [Deltaproteobacteria bacterium]
MINTTILSWVTFIYFGSAIFYIFKMVTGKEFWGSLASIIAFIGLIAQTVGLILRWFESYKMGIGHAPLSNLYESLIFFSWTIVLLYLIIEWRIKSRNLGAFVVPFAFFSMAFASFSPNVNARIQPLIPALQSNWLISHVITCFFGYAALTIACGLGFMYLLKGLEKGERPRLFFRLLPGREIVDELTYQSVVIGFIFLTLGIITGSVWAYSAWGSYWSWDPKETWSLITWFIYAAMLHSRFVRGWRGKRMAIMSIIGFASVLFTYFGVNYLPGLHSYF